MEYATKYDLLIAMITICVLLLIFGIAVMYELGAIRKALDDTKMQDK